MVLEAESVKWRCWQCLSLSEAWQEDPSLPLSASGGFGCSLVGGSKTPITASTCTQTALYVSLCFKSPSPLRRVPVIGFRAHSKSSIISSVCKWSPVFVTSRKPVKATPSQLPCHGPCSKLQPLCHPPEGSLTSSSVLGLKHKSFFTFHCGKKSTKDHKDF